MAEADRLNLLPFSIKKTIPYKCTTCLFFHVGRTTEDIIRPKIDSIEVIPEKITKELITQIFEEKKELPKDLIQRFEATNIFKKESHDDFDWETNKRIL